MKYKIDQEVFFVINPLYMDTIKNPIIKGKITEINTSITIREIINETLKIETFEYYIKDNCNFCYGVKWIKEEELFDNEQDAKNYAKELINNFLDKRNIENNKLHQALFYTE